jgi:hypothetical protein
MRRSEAGRLQPMRLCACIVRFVVTTFVLFAISAVVHAQFKVIGPPPFPAPEARKKIRTLLEQVGPGNTEQTIATLSDWLKWYRDILDEELIAAWQKDGRANLLEVVRQLSTPRVASGIVDVSWRQQRQATFNLAYAPMFVDLMMRFPDSAKSFLDDLLAVPPPALLRSEAEGVCRIFIDMPDDRTWRNNALQILPHYRPAAEALLNEDFRGNDPEKSYRARRWLNDLRFGVPGSPGGGPSSGNSPSSRPIVRRSSPPPPSVPDSSRTPAPTYAPPTPPQPEPVTLAPSPALPSMPQSYEGPRSGTLECSGGPVAQNAEFVFRNLPPSKLKLDYDTNNWDAHLGPGDKPGTQRLVLRNKGTGPQKHCTVHWSIIP